MGSTTVITTSLFRASNASIRDSKQFSVLQGFRALISVALVLFLAETVDLGIATSYLIAASVVGVYSAGRFLWKNSSSLRAIIIHAVLLLTFWIFATLTEVILIGDLSSPASRDFFVFQYVDVAKLLFIAYFASFVTTWFFWTRRGFLTFEAVVLGTTFIWLLSGHRNYHLDAPKALSALAWNIGLSPQHMLLFLALVFSVFLGSYFVLAHERPIFFQLAPFKTFSKQRKLFVFCLPTVILALLVAFAAYVNSTYSSNLSRASNGVGTEGKQQGESPLGFHSAIGQTRQPAALVRLEGDYEENPWLPMLYLREGALSSYNGKELVNAPANFDRDVPRVNPGEPFVAVEQPVGDSRKKVTQSIYLLTQHSAPFGLDTPTVIRLIKNPEEKKFSLAYQVDSQAPTEKVQDLLGNEVGDPDWDEATRAHYLEAPGSKSIRSLQGLSYSSEQPILDEYGEDLRYRLLAQELTKDADSQVLKAALLVDYLSKESIYTRKPGHTVTEGGDPVAPYLFSTEKRGYCVHFAHAAVYMMRLLGIPARIATGYLTDLTYAKDGHILLHLGDRHAWPEVYISGRGWIVLDVTPANAENEQVIIPDEKLLEELMSKIDPAQALVTPPPPAPQDPVEKSLLDQVLTRKRTVQGVLVILIGYLLLKLYLREGWRLRRNPRTRARLAYASIAGHAVDLGLIRETGETRIEYQERLRRVRGIDVSHVTHALELVRYAANPLLTREEIDHAAWAGRQSLKTAKIGLRRIFSFINPSSLTRWAKL